MRITESLRAVERQLVSHYLFDDGLVREQPFDLSPLKALIEANLVDLVGCVESAFHQGWPEADGEVTTSVVLRAHVQDMVTGLSEVIGRLIMELGLIMTSL